MVDHEEDSTGVTAIVRVTNIIHQDQQQVGPMSLWMHWWTAIWRLRPAFSRLQTFLWFATAVARLHRAYGHAGRDQHRARTEPRCSLLQYALIDHFHSSAVKLDRLTALLDPGGAAAIPPAAARQRQGASWSATASRSPSAAARCRRSSSCISSPKQIPSPNSSWGTPLQAVSLLVQENRLQLLRRAARRAHP